MRIGDLRHRVEIQQASRSEGQQKATWATIATRWAHVKEVQAKESEEATSQQVKAQKEYLVTLRYCDLSPARHRFLHDGTTLHIETVLHDEVKTETTCTCNAEA